jgi:NhaP-type Na+/H+ or K+/H+ antiporter
MLENLQTVGLLTFMEIVGPLLLGAAIAYAIWRTRRRSRRQQTKHRAAFIKRARGRSAYDGMAT